MSIDGIRKPVSKNNKTNKEFVNLNKYPAYPQPNNRNAKITKRHPKKRLKIIPFLKKFFYILLVFLILVFLFLGIYFVWKINKTGNKIIIRSSNKTETGSSFSQIISNFSNSDVKLRGEKRGRINVLLLGIAGNGNAGGNLTDTIMIASIDTKNNKIALLSLPRDLYIKIPNTSYQTKINAVYKIDLKNNKDISYLKNTIKNITGLTVDYYIVANFSGFEKFVDIIGGINIDVKRDIYDPHYPGPNYSYELFEIKKGFHKMDGSTALKYARERHNDPEGDFGRAKRQQQVLQAIKNKLFSTQIIFNPFKLNALLNNLERNIKTDASLAEIKSFLNLSKNIDTQNITNVVVDAWNEDSLLKVSHVFTDSGRMFILVPRIGNYSEIRDLAKNIFNLDVIKKRNDKIKQENANIGIMNMSDDKSLGKKIQNLLQNKLHFKNANIIKPKKIAKLSQTILIDLTEKQKPITLDELIKKLPAKLSTELQKNVILDEHENIRNCDILIILGNDLINAYKYKEDSKRINDLS